MFCVFVKYFKLQTLCITSVGYEYIPCIISVGYDYVSYKASTRLNCMYNY